MSTSASEEKAPPSDRRVLVGALFRERQKRVTLREAPPPAPVRRPAHMARMLALAHHLQSAIDRGLVPDRAEVARRLGLTRARVTQLLDLLLLAPDLQDEVLHLEAVDGLEPLSERALRAVAHAGMWAEQRATWQRKRRVLLEAAHRNPRHASWYSNCPLRSPSSRSALTFE